MTCHDDAYGIDGGIFPCIDLQTGDRKWKGGRYGKGQVLLLENSGVRLVAAEVDRGSDSQVAQPTSPLFGPVPRMMAPPMILRTMFPLALTRPEESPVLPRTSPWIFSRSMPPLAKIDPA